MPIIVPPTPKITLPGRVLFLDDIITLCATVTGQNDPDPLVAVAYPQPNQANPREQEMRLSETDLSRVASITFPSNSVSRNRFEYDRTNQAAALVLGNTPDKAQIVQAILAWGEHPRPATRQFLHRLGFLLKPARFDPAGVRLVPVTRHEYYAAGLTARRRAWNRAIGIAKSPLGATLIGLITLVAAIVIAIVGGT